VVISCTEGKNGYEVILDQTAFFPEGGGQPADQGWLGDSFVKDTRDKKEYVLHICDKPLEEGSTVCGKIDWNRRFLHMQQHSGEHIFSGIIHRLTGFDNIGFHMGKDFVTVDFSGLVSEEIIEEAERLANEKILEDVEILAEYPSEEELEVLEYRSKKEIDGDLRIVTVPGADVCACCGTHVKHTGEIGPVKVTGSEHYKSGIRLTLKIGWEALEDYQMKHANIKAISALLSVPPEQTADAVAKLQEQLLQLKNANVNLKQKIFEGIIKEIPEGSKAEIYFDPELNSVEVRKLADGMAAKTEFAAVFAGNDQDGYKYVMVSSVRDVASMGKEFNRVLNGRGGGKNPMIQGSVQAEEIKIREYLDRII
jgi:alanyl-tRNA synthetase